MLSMRQDMRSVFKTEGEVDTGSTVADLPKK